MDITSLRAAYGQFIDAARDRGDAVAPDGEWPPRLVLAHVVVSDRLVAEAAARLLDGEEPHYDNRPSQSRPYLEAVASAAGDWEGLLEAVRRGGEELMALLEQLDDERASVPVQALIMDGGEAALDGPMPLIALARAQASVHLPGHAEQLRSYSPASPA